MIVEGTRDEDPDGVEYPEAGVYVGSECRHRSLFAFCLMGQVPNGLDIAKIVDVFAIASLVNVVSQDGVLVAHRGSHISGVGKVVGLGERLWRTRWPPYCKVIYIPSYAYRNG